jgi:hypothetical protein
MTHPGNPPSAIAEGGMILAELGSAFVWMFYFF